MKKLLLSMVSLLIASGAMAEIQSVASIDGQLVVNVTDDGGTPSYSVTLGGKTFLEASPLGLLTDIGDFTCGMSMTAASQVEQVSDSYSVPDIKKSHVDYTANRRVFTFSKDGNRIYDVVFQLSGNDVALKYVMYPQGDSLCCIIKKEATGFVVPEGTTTFLCPQVKPKGGFARTYPSYEMPYTADDATGKNGLGEGFTFPCLFRNSDNGWILISETGVSSAYCGSRLLCDEGGKYVIGFPQEDEYNGNGTTCPGIRLPGETPWRTITVGETLAPIVETTVPFDVVRPLYEPSKQYKYGAGSWSWIIGMDESINYDEQVRYIDFSAAMGWQTVLVDNWWDANIGRDGIEKLARYAAGKGVALFLWYNSNGYWNDAPQTPRGIMNNTIARRREMKWLQSIGIRGIKVDFFGSDKQVTMQLYEDILADANDYGLLVVFHGCTIPRGWERMYPNYVSSEAVLASENLHFAQSFCDAEAFNACIHTFCRNTLGSMDFGGSTLNNYYNPENSADVWGGKRVTSDVFALATAVLFQSAVQHFAMSPTNLTDAPEWAVDFMKNVPTTWDDVRFLDGYPGKYVVMARKKAGKWYVAGVNAQQETLKLKLPLEMLGDGELTLYKDDRNLAGEKTTAKLNKKKELQVTIPCNGGFVLMEN